MARQGISLDDFVHMEIDPESGKLYWKGREVVTQLTLPWIVHVSATAVAIAAIVSGLKDLIDMFK